MFLIRQVDNVTVCFFFSLSLGVAEEERGHLHPPTMKLSRSLSVPGPDDIPPPPDTSAPEPPLPASRRAELTHANAAPPMPPSYYLPHGQVPNRAPPHPPPRRVSLTHSEGSSASLDTVVIPCTISKLLYICSLTGGGRYWQKGRS